jgi:hypothetical protein
MNENDLWNMLSKEDQQVNGRAWSIRTASRIRPPRSVRITLVRILTLAILALVLCSCADFKGFHLKPAADGDRDGFGHGYVSGSGDPS